MLDTFRQDVRYALRLSRISPGFAVIAIASLALGTGANTAIFQLLDAVRLRTLPVPAPQNLAELRIDDMTHARGTWLRDAALTNPLWERIRENQKAFSGSFAWADESLETSPNGESHRINGLWVTGDFFNVLGVKPLLGRVFSLSDDKRGCGFTPGAVISYGFWQREFGGDPAVIGKTTVIGKNRVPVVGVTPASFFGLEVGRTFDVALPVCSEAALAGGNERLDSGTTWWLTVMGRLKPGLSLPGASAIMCTESPGIFKAALPPGYPPDSVRPYLAMKLLVNPAGHGISHLREQYAKPLVLLLGIAALVLLIACGNLANLMLARASARQREMAVRIAIGASKARLARQLLSEGLLLALAGCGVGLLLAQALSRFLVAFLATGDNAMFVDIRLDVQAFAFTASLGMLTCLLFAAAPIIRATRTNPGQALSSDSRTVTSGRERLGMRRVLVVSQIAVSLVLLLGTLLFVRSLFNLETLNPGFRPHGLSIVDIDFSDLNKSAAHSIVFRRELLDRLRALPGVSDASEATIIPLNGADWNNRVWIDGSDLQHAHVAMRTMVGAGYIHALGTPIVTGREFDERDIASSSKVAVVNEEFARQLIGNLNVIGRRFWIEATPYERQTAFEILGVVKNTKYGDLREDFQPIMFLPLSQAALEASSARVIIRSSLRPDALATSVRSTLAAVNPNIRYSFRIFDSTIQESLLRERLMATLSAFFGVLAILLTMAGLYGVIAYTVALRTREIGIRMAFGANRTSVSVLIMREAVLVLGLGLITGYVFAFVSGRAASSLLFGVESRDPAMLAMAGGALVLATIVATCVPTLRASSLNPVNALQQD